MLVHNIRYTLRLLRRSPGFTATALVTLALGIGANTAVFSVVDGVILRPLPYPEPHRLVSLWENNTRLDPPRSNVAPANLVDYVRSTRTFDGLAGYASTSMSLTKTGTPEQLLGEAITWNYFGVVGTQPALGRAFLPEEDRAGSGHVVILTDALWRARFAGNPDILGRTITLNNESYEVVGVTPPGFQPLTQFRSTVPVVFFVPAAYPDALLANHGDHEIGVVARLKDGVTLAQAQADLDGVTADLARRFPDSNQTVRALVAPMAADIARNVRTSLLVMLGAVGLVLLIACANLANLLIVRAIGQRQEVAIRMAIGATRGQVAAQMLTRDLVLGLLGGAAGLLLGIWTRDVLVALAPSSIPRLDHLTLSGRVLGVTAALSALAGLLAGAVPAIQMSRGDAVPALKGAAANASGARAILRWRGALMAAEIAAALMLAVGAGLLIRSLGRLNAVELGFQTENVLTFLVRLPDAKYATPRERHAFFEALAPRVQALPGVRQVAFANQFPMRGGWGSGIRVAGVPADDQTSADFQAVSPSYFAALGIPLLRGRLLEETDRDGALRVAVVSETFVKRYANGRDPIGLTFSRGGREGPAITIVGVVAEIRRDGREAEIAPQVFLSAAQTELYPVRLASVAVRAAGDPRALVPGIQRAVWAIDPDQPITSVRTLDEVLVLASAQRRFTMTLLSWFAALAVGLALVGVYGVVAYAVAQRTREIGIRVALGASRRDVVSLVVRSGLAWALGGIAAGLAGAVAISRAMATLLFEIGPDDPATFATIAIAMLAVAFSATYVPALRAARVDPLVALKGD
jgi:putative ABC transport system permease protein